MTPEQIEIERAKFESWIGFSYTDQDLDRVKRLPSGRYMSPSTYRQWESWLAALRHSDVVVSREWLGLTDDEIDNSTLVTSGALLDHIYEYGTMAEGVNFRMRDLARAVEAKLKEKNT